MNKIPIISFESGIANNKYFSLSSSGAITTEASITFYLQESIGFEVESRMA